MITSFDINYIMGAKGAQLMQIFLYTIHKYMYPSYNGFKLKGMIMSRYNEMISC